MTPNEHSDKQTDRTLGALEGIERATPRPFFFTRVQARLTQHQTAKTATHRAFRPALLATSLGMVLLLNASTVMVYHYRLSMQEQQQAAEHFSEEWGADPETLDLQQP